MLWLIIAILDAFNIIRYGTKVKLTESDSDKFSRGTHISAQFQTADAREMSTLSAKELSTEEARAPCSRGPKAMRVSKTNSHPDSGHAGACLTPPARVFRPTHLVGNSRSKNPRVEKLGDFLRQGERSTLTNKSWLESNPRNSPFLLRELVLRRTAPPDNIYIHIYTSTHLHIYTSTHLHIYTSTHLHIYTSTHLRIYTSTHSHITFPVSTFRHIVPRRIAHPQRRTAPVRSLYGRALLYRGGAAKGRGFSCPVRGVWGRVSNNVQRMVGHPWRLANPLISTLP